MNPKGASKPAEATDPLLLNGVAYDLVQHRFDGGPMRWRPAAVAPDSAQLATGGRGA